MTYVKYIEELRDVIRRAHGVESKQVRSLAVKVTVQDKTVWDGIVEVFKLSGHPTATHAYAWSQDTNDPEHPRRHVAVLQLHPTQSAQDAVKAAMVQEFENLGTADESQRHPA